MELFVGALHSPKFIGGTRSANYQRAHLILKPLAMVDPAGSWNCFRLSMTHIHEDAARYRDEFERLPLDATASWLWRGWGGTTKRGDNVTFPLYPVYHRLGQDFTRRFDEILQTFVSTRAHGYIKGISSFTQFIGNYPGPLTASSFDDPYWTGALFNEFARHFFTQAHTLKREMRYAARGWSTTFLPMVDALVAGRLMAAPEPALAAPRSGVVVNGRETRIKRCPQGIEVKANSLTPIPLELSDGAAKEILFRHVIDDFAAVTTWAEAEVDDLWRRHVAGRRASEVGTVRQPGTYGGGNVGIGWLTHPDNPDALANCAATYWSRGLQVDLSAKLAYRRYGLLDVAHDLGIPGPRSFLPHAALLVANHCEITTSFLKNLELFDKNGKEFGVQTLEGSTYLVGNKPRKGAELAEQRIRLNSRTAEVVRQVIALTAPLRTFLKARNDDAWRYLFLATKSICSVPNAQNLTVQVNKMHRYGKHGFAESLSRRAVMPSDKAQELAANFSLRALRGSAALVVYINTGSSLAMSEALGHETYSPKLLDHYLPEPIQRFFRERWIRVFQAGLVCQAMKDSPMLLEASGFKTIEELDAFLSEHALKNIPVAEQLRVEKAAATELVIDVGEKTLTLLLSVTAAVSGNAASCNGRAVYWAEVGARVAEYLASLSDRPDLQASLEAAQRNAAPDDVLELVLE